MPQRRFQSFVTDTFVTASEDLERELGQVIAEHAAQGHLHSGATVKRMARKFEAIAAVAVDRSRDAAGSSTPRRTYLAKALPALVDKLANQTVARLTRLEKFDGRDEKHINRLMGGQRERVMRVRQAPAVKLTAWERAQAVVGSLAMKIVAGVLLSAVLAWLGLKG